LLPSPLLLPLQPLSAAKTQRIAAFVTRRVQER
jgi:hypothetical protein